MNNNSSDSNSAKTYQYGRPQGNAGADANSAQNLDGEEVDKFEQFKKRLKEHPEDMIILSELMKPKF